MTFLGLVVYIPKPLVHFVWSLKLLCLNMPSGFNSFLLSFTLYLGLFLMILYDETLRGGREVVLLQLSISVWPHLLCRPGEN